MSYDYSENVLVQKRVGVIRFVMNWAGMSGLLEL